ncbi:hypothetical protein HRbin02_00965 [Candidatus Calditenuaceae archaeon HR02]|nr:hypothetical protein HRbin02_00965 [Candidatus Calditenuaceae archaeon HR02]
MSQDEFEERLREVKSRLMEIEGVSGVGIGGHQGSLYVIVMLREDDKDTCAKIERLMRDIPIPYRILVSGEFQPLKGVIHER